MAGAGFTTSPAKEAKKTGEAQDGIARLLRLPSVPGVLEPYRDLVRGFGTSAYPGSPLIAAKLLRAQDRLVAIEKHPGRLCGSGFRARATSGRAW